MTHMCVKYSSFAEICPEKCGTKLLIHYKTSVVAPRHLGMDKSLHPTRYCGCNYLSMLGSKSIEIGFKRFKVYTCYC